MTRIWYKHRQIFLKGKNTNTPLDMISTGESFAQTANGSDSVRSLGEEVLEEASLRCVTVVRLLFTSQSRSALQWAMKFYRNSTLSNTHKTAADLDTKSEKR